MPEVSEANAPAEKGDPVAQIPPEQARAEHEEALKAAGSVESEPAALVPEGVAAAEPTPLDKLLDVMAPPTAEELKAKAAAVEAYIQAGIDKVVAAVGQTEIVTVAAFKLAVEALLRHLHADHPENYL